MKKNHDPNCEYCNGTGSYYWHSEDCDDDLCALAGGYHDCNGQIIECDCTDGTITISLDDPHAAAATIRSLGGEKFAGDVAKALLRNAELEY